MLEHGRDLVKHFPVTVIQGARQVGKSTLAGMLVDGSPHRLVTLDDALILRAAQADPDAFVRQAPGATLVIDEAQLDPSLTRALKRAVDEDRTPGGFILTGSANLLRAKADADSLAGRAVTLNLRGLSQGELHRVRDDFVAVVLAANSPDGASSAWGREQYVDALGRGGFPELQRNLSARLVNAWLDSYLERILERDATTLPSGGATARLRSIAKLLAAVQGEELVKARLAEQAHIPQATITGYLDALEAVYLVDVLRPWTPNLTRREIGRPKSLIADPALALRLAGIRPAQLLPLIADQFGHHLEAFAASELLKQQGWSEQEYQLHHYRDRDGLEVDIVVELADGGIIGIEVKAASSFRPDHFTNLLKFADRVGPRFRRGIVLSTARTGVAFTRNCWGLPLSALWSWSFGANM